MADFLAEMLETFLNVGLIAFIGRWATREFTSQPPNAVGFALALGLYVGRSQAGGLSEAGQLGHGLGGLLCLALLWIFWFKGAREEVSS